MAGREEYMYLSSSSLCSSVLRALLPFLLFCITFLSINALDWINGTYKCGDTFIGEGFIIATGLFNYYSVAILFRRLGWLLRILNGSSSVIKSLNSSPISSNFIIIQNIVLTINNLFFLIRPVYGVLFNLIYWCLLLLFRTNPILYGNALLTEEHLIIMQAWMLQRGKHRLLIPPPLKEILISLLFQERLHITGLYNYR